MDVVRVQLARLHDAIEEIQWASHYHLLRPIKANYRLSRWYRIHERFEVLYSASAEAALDYRTKIFHVIA